MKIAHSVPNDDNDSETEIDPLKTGNLLLALNDIYQPRNKVLKITSQQGDGLKPNMNYFFKDSNYTTSNGNWSQKLLRQGQSYR